MMTLTSGCPFCGQGHVVTISKDATEQEIRTAAIRQCCCEGAEKHKEMASVRKTVEKLFGKQSEEKFGASFTLEVQEDLIEWAERVYDELYEKIVVTMEGGDKATISHSGRHIKVAREQVRKGEE